MLLSAGKKLKEACATRAIPARFTCRCYPPNQSGKLKERDCSCLVRFSTTFLCLIWTDLAWELKLSALFSFILSGVLFLFFGIGVFETYRFLLEKLKVMFSFSTDTVTWCINFFAILVSQVRCYCNLYLLSFIVTMYWTKFLYELYSNSRVLIHYFEGHYFILFFVSIIIIGCHNCSYSTILIVFCTFKFSSMTLSLLHVHWILCYRIKNISFMVFIKQLKPRIFVQCKCYYTDWSLAF